MRVAHHFADAGRVFREFARVLRPGGVLVLEFANKRHLKSILKLRDCGASAGRRSARSPTNTARSISTTAPTRSGGCCARPGFRVGPIRTASLFRVGALKRRVPASVLAGIERPLQAPLGPLAIGPSVYLRARARR